MSVRFNPAGVVLRNPDYENIDEVIIPFRFGYSASGKLYRYKAGNKSTIITLRWSFLTDDEKDDLQGVFDDAMATVDSFNYKPMSGISEETVTVQFMEDSIVWTQIQDNKDTDDTYTVDSIELPTTSRICPYWSVEIKMVVVQ